MLFIYTERVPLTFIRTCRIALARKRFKPAGGEDPMIPYSPHILAREVKDFFPFPAHFLPHEDKMRQRTTARHAMAVRVLRRRSFQDTSPIAKYSWPSLKHAAAKI